MLQLMVLYPQPADVQQFETEYVKHLAFLDEKTGIATTVKPYTVTKFLPSPQGAAAFYQLFAMPFESPEALEAAMSSAGMQEVAADANRISSGGAPTILIGHTQ
ncbi:MAG: EthD family reductase [Ferruginibacter sp.]|nr:EthD family reductase [Ferruginibacter sp.]